MMRFFEIRDLLDRPVSRFALGPDTAFGRQTWNAIEDYARDVADIDGAVTLGETQGEGPFYRQILSIDGEPTFFLCDGARF